MWTLVDIAQADYASATTLYKKALTIQGFFVSERFPPFAQALLVSVVANRST